MRRICRVGNVPATCGGERSHPPSQDATSPAGREVLDWDQGGARGMGCGAGRGARGTEGRTWQGSGQTERGTGSGSGHEAGRGTGRGVGHRKGQGARGGARGASGAWSGARGVARSGVDGVGQGSAWDTRDGARGTAMGGSGGTLGPPAGGQPHLCTPLPSRCLPRDLLQKRQLRDPTRKAVFGGSHRHSS